MKNVRGRVVLITGAGGGIGRLMSLEFAKLGAKLVVVDKDGKAAEETASIARSLGVEARSGQPLAQVAQVHDALIGSQL